MVFGVLRRPKRRPKALNFKAVQGLTAQGLILDVLV